MATDAFLLESRTGAVNAPLPYDDGVSTMVAYHVIMPTVESLDPSGLEEPLGLVEHLVEGHDEHLNREPVLRDKVFHVLHCIYAAGHGVDVARDSVK
jgi:hypothetical protein